MDAVPRATPHRRSATTHQLGGVSPPQQLIGGRTTVGLLLVVLTATGCFAAGPRDPAIVGVIEQRENVGDGQWRFLLQTGETVVIDTDEDERMEGSAGGQAIGDLLLVGQAAGQDWYMGLPPRTMRPAGVLTEYECFVMTVFATDAEDFLVFDNGLRLRKADNFDPRSHIVDNRFDNPRAALCVTEDGEVLF
jgi:hypothetical protein